MDKFRRLGLRLNAVTQKYIVVQPVGKAVSGQDEDGDDVWLDLETPKLVYYFTE